MKRYRMRGPECVEAPDGEWANANDAEAEVTRLRSALGEALDGWRTLFEDECGESGPPETLVQLMRDYGVEMEYVNDRWRAIVSKETP